MMPTYIATRPSQISCVLLKKASSLGMPSLPMRATQGLHNKQQGTFNVGAWSPRPGKRTCGLNELCKRHTGSDFGKD